MPLRYLLTRLGMLKAIPLWDLRSLELVSGIFMFGWGFQTLYSDALHSNEVYRPFLDLAPATGWGVVMTLVGGLQIVASLWHLPLLTRYSALAAGGVWAFTVLALFHVSPRLASLPGYVALCVGCLWLHVRG